MNIYVFGNQDMSCDNLALQVAKRLHDVFPKIKFQISDPNSFDPQEKCLLIMDTCAGISKVKVIADVALLKSPPTNTIHDYDITFLLKLLKKLGKISSVQIITIPQTISLESAVKQISVILESISKSENLSSSSCRDHRP